MGATLSAGGSAPTLVQVRWWLGGEWDGGWMGSGMVAGWGVGWWLDGEWDGGWMGSGMVAGWCAVGALMADPRRGLQVDLYINSPGGEFVAGMAMYDTMQYISCPVHTTVVGRAASMASLLLAAGEPGQRRCRTRSPCCGARRCMAPAPCCLCRAGAGAGGALFVLRRSVVVSGLWGCGARPSCALSEAALRPVVTSYWQQFCPWAVGSPHQPPTTNPPPAQPNHSTTRPPPAPLTHYLPDTQSTQRDSTIAPPMSRCNPRPSAPPVGCPGKAHSHVRGILQPPLLRQRADPVVNMGARNHAWTGARAHGRTQATSQATSHAQRHCTRVSHWCFLDQRRTRAAPCVSPASPQGAAPRPNHDPRAPGRCPGECSGRGDTGGRAHEDPRHGASAVPETHLEVPGGRQ